MKQNLIAAVNRKNCDVITKNKEEGQVRILADSSDRAKIKEKLSTRSLETGILNIVSG